jgi:hypothetical protein
MQNLSLGGVQLKAIGGRPCSNILYAGYDLVLEAGSLQRMTETVDWVSSA